MKYLKALSALLVFSNIGFTSNDLDCSNVSYHYSDTDHSPSDIEYHIERYQKKVSAEENANRERNCNIHKYKDKYPEKNSLPNNIASKVKYNELKSIYYTRHNDNPTSESVVDEDAKYNYYYAPLFYKANNKNINKTSEPEAKFYRRMKLKKTNNEEDCKIF